MPGWASVDFRHTERDPAKDCVAPPLLAWVAALPERAGGWRRLWNEKAGPAVGILPRSVTTELKQMHARGTLEVRDLGDGDFDVRITDAGRARLEG